jgi:hypothetical protein
VIGQNRYNNLSSELENALVPLVVAEKSTLSFLRSLAARFNVSLSGSREYGPICAWIPDQTQPKGFHRVRWERVAGMLEYKRLRLVIMESPALFASFAMSRPLRWPEDKVTIEAEEHDLASFPELIQPNRMMLALPRNIIPTKSFTTVWNCTSPLVHGADEKYGNVSLFRRQRTIDRVTGEPAYVPFMSGNAVRGLWRDLIVARYFELLGINPSAVPPSLVHALFAGGSIESGADTGKVDVALRRLVRKLCPPTDLLGGCIAGQIMGGRIRVHDAIVVCKENAWLVKEKIAPEKELTELHESLPDAADLSQLRLLTRQKHAEYDNSDGVQMLVNTEALLPGTQLIHSFQVFGLDGVHPITQACLADMMFCFEGQSTVGAGNARGYGLIAFDAYKPGPGTPQLESAETYWNFIETNKAEITEAIFAAMQPKSDKNEPAKTAKKGKGGKKTEGDLPNDAELVF